MSNGELIFSNYCACFIDLLGQRNALCGQDLLPAKEQVERYAVFREAARASIGAIKGLQDDASYFRDGLREAPSIREFLPDSEKPLYDEMIRAKPKQQRWSDGLFFYQSLSSSSFKCPMNAVTDMFMHAGTLCLLSLSRNNPIRGAIEISWGVELHDGELYGAAVKNSYELESDIAKWPRVVVGNHAIGYLKSIATRAITESDKLAVYNRDLAELCLSLTKVDVDGFYILDYLGKSFAEKVFKESRKEIYEDAYRNVCSQLELHVKDANSKLVERYSIVKKYFDENPD